MTTATTDAVRDSAKRMACRALIRENGIEAPLMALDDTAPLRLLIQAAREEAVSCGETAAAPMLELLDGYIAAETADARLAAIGELARAANGVIAELQDSASREAVAREFDLDRRAQAARQGVA